MKSANFQQRIIAPEEHDHEGGCGREGGVDLNLKKIQVFKCLHTCLLASVLVASLSKNYFGPGQFTKNENGLKLKQTPRGLILQRQAVCVLLSL